MGEQQSVPANEKPQIKEKAEQLINKKSNSLTADIETIQKVLPKNRFIFPYARGYHFFFDLSEFPRVEGTRSYASDEANVFGSTYLQEEKKFGELTVGELINRKYIGLPVEEMHTDFSNHSRDKNICHGFLFMNEDRKYQIDRNLA